jgi:hypothetical protein
MYQPPEEMLIRGTAALLAYMQRLLQAKSLHTREQVTISSPDFLALRFWAFFLVMPKGSATSNLFPGSLARDCLWSSAISCRVYLIWFVFVM